MHSAPTYMQEMVLENDTSSCWSLIRGGRGNRLRAVVPRVGLGARRRHAWWNGHMMGGMWLMGLIGILVIVALALGAAALIKYLRKK